MTATAPALTVDLERQGRTAVARVRGELDLATAPLLHAALAPVTDDPAGLGLLVVDLAEMPFADLVGLRALLRLRDLLGPAGCVVQLRAAPSAVRRLLGLLGLDEALGGRVPRPR